MELLAAYSNTLPELQQALDALFDLPDMRDASEPGSACSPPRKLRSPLPRSISSRLISDYQAGSSSRKLAATYGLPKTSVLNILKNAGVLRAREQITEEQVLLANRLIQNGASVSKAAEALGVARRTLYYQLKARGFPPRAS